MCLRKIGDDVWNAYERYERYLDELNGTMEVDCLIILDYETDIERFLGRADMSLLSGRLARW